MRQAFNRNCKELVFAVDFLHKGMCKRCDFVTIEPTEQADQLTDRSCYVPVKILADAPWNSGADVVKAAFRNKISNKTHHVTSFVRNFMVNVTSIQTANLKLATDKPQPRQTGSMLLVTQAQMRLCYGLQQLNASLTKIDYQRPMTFHHAPPANNQTAR